MKPGSNKELHNKQLKNEEIDSKILAISHLMEHGGWSAFAEMIQYLQGIESAKLFNKRFLGLSPEEKDKEHQAIVAVIKTLDKLLHLPQWLANRKPERWNQVVTYLNKEANNNG